jgi:hypothetical protein
MRASDLIRQLEELMREHGDRFVIYHVEDSSGTGAVSVEEIEIEPYYETKYFKLR